jgi:thiol:disulfide interchange protein
MDRRLAGKGMRGIAVAALLAVGGMTACNRHPSAEAPVEHVEQPAPMATAPKAAGQSNPIPHAHIYPDVAMAKPDIQAALVKARREHKRVILDFGGDWCPDCQVLNIYFHQSPNKELMEKNYELVDVNIGHMDENLDVAHKYDVPVKGVPALAVVDPSGKVVYAQNKEFSNMRSLESSDLTTFLEAWKRR